MARRSALGVPMACVAAVIAAIALLAAPVTGYHDGGFNANTNSGWSSTDPNWYSGGGPSFTNEVQCTTQTFGPDFGCNGSTGTCTRSGADCNQYTWEYSNYKYFVLDERPNLPKPFTGIPRVDVQTNKEYVGQMALTDSYIGSVIGQALPGLVIAILLILSMILVLVFYIISSCCKCFGCCKCCFRPSPYTRKQLHIAKGVQLLFVALAACGCFVIFSASPDVSDGVQSIVNGLLSASTQLTNDISSISDALGTLSSNSGDINSQLDMLEDASTAVTKAISKTSDAIERAKEQVQLAADIVSGVLLGVAVITMILSVLNFWRILILFSVLTSLILIITWIVVGALAAVGVFLDDFCYTINEYLIDPDRVDLSKDIPCPDESDVIEFGGAFRTLVAYFVDKFNGELATWNGGQTSSQMLNYICMPYQSQTWADLCGTAADVQAGTFKAFLWYDDYANYVCKAYHEGKLETSFTNSHNPMPKWGGCYYTNYTFNARVASNVQSGSTGLTFGVDLDWANTTYYGAVSTTATSTLNDVIRLKNVIPTFESILKCEFISNTFAWISPGCGDTVEAIQMVWRGFIVTAVGYLCLWITMLATIGRMSNPDLMIDGGRFDARKAGLI